MLEGLSKEQAAAAKAAAALEAEREKRIEQLGQQILRRIVQKDLAAGWQAWHEMYAEHVRQKQLLANSAARLSKPLLTAAFKQWFHDWDAAEKEKLELGLEVLRQEQNGERMSLQQRHESELAKVKAELEKAQKQLAEGLSKEERLAKQMAEKLEAER